MSGVQVLGMVFIALGLGVVIGWACIYWSEYRVWKRGMDEMRATIKAMEDGWHSEMTEEELLLLNKRPSTKQRSRR